MVQSIQPVDVAHNNTGGYKKHPLLILGSTFIGNKN